MIDLKHAVQEKGFTVAHIKTDSIKIPNATKEIIDFVLEFGRQYGYDFEHEATYEKFCLFNDAEYIARENGVWIPKGKKLLDNYVFKMLFSNEELEFEDFVEAHSVLKGAMYLDFNKDLDRKDGFTENEDTRFLGRTGLFVPVREGCGGGLLYRVHEGKVYSVPTTKGYLWKEASMATRDELDMDFYNKKLDKMKKAIADLGDYEDLIS